MVGTTASVDLKNHTLGEANAIAKHNSREHENYENEFINEENADLNRHYQVDGLKNLEQSVAQLIDERDKRAIQKYVDKKYSRKQFEQAYVVDAYDLLSRPSSGKSDSKMAFTSAVFQIGDSDFYKSVLERENIPYEFDEKKGFTYPDKGKLQPLIDVYERTFNAVSDEFVNSNFFVPYSKDLHMDEGYPHLQMQFLNNGVTKKGARSFSRNQAVKNFLEEKGFDVSTNNKQNLSTLRSYTDNLLIDEFNKNLQQSKFKTQDIELVREGDKSIKASSKERKKAQHLSAQNIKVLDDYGANKKAKIDDEIDNEYLPKRKRIADVKADDYEQEELAKRRVKIDLQLQADRRRAQQLRDEMSALEKQKQEKEEELEKLNTEVVDAKELAFGKDTLSNLIQGFGFSRMAATRLAAGETLHLKSGGGIDASGAISQGVLQATDEELKQRRIEAQTSNKLARQRSNYRVKQQQSSDDLER